MTNSSKRKPLVDQTIHAFPRESGFLAASHQRAVPEPSHLKAECLDGRAVHWYSVVPNMPAHHRLEPRPNIGHGVVHSLSQFVFHLFELGSKPFLDGLPNHREFPVAPFLPADVREAKEVERLRFSLSAFLPVFSRIRAKLQKPRLFGMQFQLELLESFRQFPQKLLGFLDNSQALRGF